MVDPYTDWVSGVWAVIQCSVFSPGDRDRLPGV